MRHDLRHHHACTETSDKRHRRFESERLLFLRDLVCQGLLSDGTKRQSNSRAKELFLIGGRVLHIPLADYCVRIHNPIEGQPRGPALHSLCAFAWRPLEETHEACDITGPGMSAYLTRKVSNRPVDQYVRPQTALHLMACIDIVQTVYHNPWYALELLHILFDGYVETVRVASGLPKMIGQRLRLWP